MLLDNSQIFYLVVAGFVGWALHVSIQFYLTGNKIRIYLEIAINTPLDEVDSNNKTLTDCFENKVIVGEIRLILTNHLAG